MYKRQIGVLCENASTPEVHWCTIAGNGVYGILNRDPGVVVNAENNYWGDKSGPSGAGPGTGDKVSEYVDFDPWVGGALPSNRKEHKVQPGKGKVDAKADADIEVEYDTDVPLTISTMKYNSNPGKAFDGDLGKYIDVHLNSSKGVNEIVIRLYYTEAELKGKDESKLKMFWWDGEKWVQCSDTGADTTDTGAYAGYIWAKIGDDTSPSLSDMTGTPFGAAEVEESGTLSEEEGMNTTLAVSIIVVLILLGVVSFMLYSKGMLTAGKEDEEKLPEKKAEEVPVSYTHLTLPTKA